MSDDNVNHHKRFKYCENRLKYRSGKHLTAVKVYTVANESKYLYVFGVPKINLQNEVKKEFLKFGPIKSVILVTDKLLAKGIEIEIFTDCYRIEFQKIEHARRAKKFLDARNFYGGILHISYAPECESLDELREKINKRKSEVNFRLKVLKKEKNTDVTTDKEPSTT